MLRRTAFAIVLLTFSSVLSLAAPATPEGAAKMKAGIESYVSATPGLVTVTPNGEQYDVKIDLVPLAAKFSKSGATLTMTPQTYKVTDVGNGKWEVVQDEVFAFAFKAGKELDMRMTAGKARSTATYDEALGAFSSAKAEFADLAMEQTTATPDGATSTVSYKLKSMTYDATASGTSNALNIDYSSGLTGLEETILVPMSAGAPPQSLKITAPAASQTGSMKGVRMSALKGMVGWFVEHAGDTDLAGKEAEVRKMLNDAMPLFDTLTGDMVVDKATVETPLGPFGADKVLLKMDVNGVVADGVFREALEMQGLSLPPGLVPPFATDLVPQKFAIDFKLSEFNLAEAAKVFINEFDFSSKQQSPEFDAKMLAAIIPSGSVTIATEATQATSKVYDLAISGAMKAGPSSQPTGKATIRLKGLDEVVKALQASPPEMGLQQGVAGLLMAKGFGKADGDALVWEVDAMQPGSVLVNGIDVTKMGGAAP